jgi:hypothetical protein
MKDEVRELLRSIPLDGLRGIRDRVMLDIRRTCWEKRGGLTFSAGPFGADVGNCSTASNAYQNTYTGSVAKSIGGGAALTRCTVTRKD